MYILLSTTQVPVELILVFLMDHRIRGEAGPWLANFYSTTLDELDEKPNFFNLVTEMGTTSK